MNTRQKLGERVYEAMSESQRHCMDALECTGLCQDTRLLEPGDLYVCVADKDRQEAFFAQAMEKGACGILVIQETEGAFQGDKESALKSNVDKQIPIVWVCEKKTVLSQMASAFYQRRPQLGIAVTGTNGKTSVSFFVAQILSHLGYPTLVLGTLGDFSFTPKMLPWTRGEVSLTTPDIFSLYRTLQKAYDRGMKAYVMEASSHGLEQGRLGSLLFDVVGVTNFSPEHLDYHGSMENYLQAKCLLFSSHLTKNGTGIVNGDNPYAEAFKAALKGKKCLTYGVKESDIQLASLSPEEDGALLSVRIKGALYHRKIKMLGEYQGLNILCALGMVMEGLNALPGSRLEEQIMDTVPLLMPPKGRMEFVGKNHSGGDIYVDYAHTPDAYEVVLRQISVYASGRLVVLFGCGGDRDAQKRPLMGHIASCYADVVYLTDDNPRTEDPESIRKEVRQGMNDPQCEIIEIPDRKLAIQDAVAHLEKGDILILLGKGHETYQINAKGSFPHSDQEIVKASLRGDKKGAHG